MSALEGIDLSALAQFRATDLLSHDIVGQGPATPQEVGLDLIEFDPLQPRRNVDEAAIEELSASVRTHGVLEPVSLRSHCEKPGRYVVNRGERRVRAARRAGLTTIPAFLDERVDPFAQAAENLHRESMSPFDLATFIAEREKEGLSRSEIARRLGKPRSFITEAARLIETPQEVRRAFEAGRVGGDIRTLYQLVAAAREKPAEASALLAGVEPITRESVEQLLSRTGPAAETSHDKRRPVASEVGRAVSGGRTVLVVEHGGRRGSLRLKAQDKDVGEVRFGNGSLSFIPLADLLPVCWVHGRPAHF